MVQPAIVGRSRQLRQFIATMTVVDGDTGFKTEEAVGEKAESARAGSYTLIWQKSVPPQSMYHFGSGHPQYPANQGMLSFGITNPEATNVNKWMEGTLRFVASNAQGTEQLIVREYHTIRLHGQAHAEDASPTASFSVDRQSLTPFPEHFPDIPEDSLMQIWFRPDADPPGGTDAKANFILPATFYV